MSKSLRLSWLVITLASFIIFPGVAPARVIKTDLDKGQLKLRLGKSDVTVKLALSDGTWAEATQEEGVPIYVQVGGKRFELVPYLNADNQISVHLSGFLNEPITAQSASAYLTSLESNQITLCINQPAAYYPGMPFSISLEAINSGAASTGRVQQVAIHSGTRCCVTCGELSVCACRVVTECGGCCQAECCN